MNERWPACRGQELRPVVIEVSQLRRQTALTRYKYIDKSCTDNVIEEIMVTVTER